MGMRSNYHPSYSYTERRAWDGELGFGGGTDTGLGEFDAAFAEFTRRAYPV